MKICVNLVVWLYAGANSCMGQQAKCQSGLQPSEEHRESDPFSAPRLIRLRSAMMDCHFQLKAPEAKNVQISGVALLTALRTSGQPVSFKKVKMGCGH